MFNFSTDGILLRKIEYGDYDFIITYFTRSMGKIIVIAKNAKKSVKRFAGSLDLFSVMNIQCVIPKRKNSFPVLFNVDLDNSFTKIRTNTIKTGYASYWVELINSWMKQGKKQIDVYNLLLYVLDALNSGIIKKEVLSLLFQIKFMSISGFTPNIICCGKCLTPLDKIMQQNILFDLIEGKLVCDKCKKNKKNGIIVSKGTLKQLFWINNKNIKKSEIIKFPDFAIKEGEKLLESFIPCHLEKEIKSLIFLKRIRK
ncbi:MAG: DNA repair protein RecO [Desulfobacteraceae bacterium 4572_130]|nr:MAG: DNA repair protein RecO [Desulfobacteraceae bacterium 4572_130]